MSNESTLLAYIRTGLAVIAAGATLIHFFIEILIQLTGGILILLGFIILLVGFRRYKQMDKSIKEIQRI